MYTPRCVLHTCVTQCVFLLCVQNAGRAPAPHKLRGMRVASPRSTLLATADGGRTHQLACAAGSRYTAPEELRAPAGDLSLLHLDDAIAVVEKPSFLPTENTRHLKDSARSRLSTLLTARGESSEGLRLPHRLDWETSGLLVFARSGEAMRALAAQFANREVRKAYLADVSGALPARSGVVELPLSADPDRLPLQQVDFGPTGRAARTEWEVVPPAGSCSPTVPPTDAAPAALSPLAARTRDDDGAEGARRCCCCCSRVRLRPESGRRHQLRMHMLALGCAICHDALYAFDTAHAGGPGTRLHLHAAELGFRHPSTHEPVVFYSEPPFGTPVCTGVCGAKGRRSSGTSASSDVEPLCPCVALCGFAAAGSVDRGPEASEEV